MTAPRNGETFTFVKKAGIVAAAVISVCTAVTLANKVLIADPISRALAPLMAAQREESEARQAGDRELLEQIRALSDRQDQMLTYLGGIRTDTRATRRVVQRTDARADSLARVLRPLGASPRIPYRR